MPRRNSNSQSKDKPRRKPQQNTGSNGGVKPQRPSSPTPSTQSAPNQFTHTRTQYLSNNLIGQTVDVQVSDGAWYQGIYTAPPINKGFCAILAYSKKIEQIDSNGQKKFAMEVIQRKVIKPDEIVQVLAKEIIFVGDMTNTNSNARDTFKTDSAISRSGEIKERELQPWKPDDNVPQPVWSPTSDNSSWDQFSTNEKLFGVKTSFNEDMYTTKLDKSSEFYKQNESRAAKLANEISKESNSNVHIANDRGIDLEMDEEDLYGAVIRNPSSIPSEGKYIPPAKKKQAAMAEKSKTMVEPASQESKITSEPKTATQLKPDNTQTSTNVGGSSAQDSETPTTETRNHINTLYCEAMQNRLLVDPSKVDPNWKSTTGSYLSTEEETPVAYYPQYVVPPMVPPMGYSPYPQIPYGYPMMQGQPPYPGFPMMMGMPPPQ